MSSAKQSSSGTQHDGGDNEPSVSSHRPSFNKSASSPANVGQQLGTSSKFNRQTSVKDRLQINTARFFGLPSPPAIESYQTDQEDESVCVHRSRDVEEEKWQQRRFRHLNKLGRIKDEVVTKEVVRDTLPRVGIDALPDLTADVSPMSVGIEFGESIFAQRAASTDSRLAPHYRALAENRPVERRESMAKIIADSLSSVVQGTAWKRSKAKTKAGNAPDGSGQSFLSGSKYASLRERNAMSAAVHCSFPTKRLARGQPLPDRRTTTDIVLSVLLSPPRPTQTSAAANKPPAPRDESDYAAEGGQSTKFISLCYAAPLCAMHYMARPRSSGLPTSHTPSPVKSLKFGGGSVSASGASSLRRPSQAPTPLVAPAVLAERLALRDAIVDSERENEALAVQTDTTEESYWQWVRRFLTFNWVRGEDEESRKIRSLMKDWWMEWMRQPVSSVRCPCCHQLDRIKLHYSLHRADGQRRVARRRTPTRRSMPCWGRMKRNLNPALQRYLEDEAYDYRPFFTVWITFVQVVVMLFLLLNYGVGTSFRHLLQPFSVIERSGDVTAPYRSTVHIVVWEQNNIWIGPRFSDLILIGAKYTPCMRRDERIYKEISSERNKEASDTGCCIGSNYGCVQTSVCPKQFATLTVWTNRGRIGMKRTRAVCGQDPRYCRNPKSVHPLEWPPTDISKWPICEETTPRSKIPKVEEHMRCEITGRPCCIQMHGQCRITSKDYCDFVRGVYHPEATLCSQISCISDVCGMMPFFWTDYPDQIYRLITPLFIHAGLIRLLISVAIQLTFMWRFEVMVGWIRLSIIYFVSGMGGYLASAIFVPYMPEVGPAGSQGGILGAMIINLIYNWDFLAEPRTALLKHLAIVFIGFITGLLPWIDNWAQVFGFIIGGLLAIALIPFIKPHNRRAIIVVASLGAVVTIFIVLFVIFYAYPNINLPLLELLNCPFKSFRICDHQGLTLRNWLPI